MWSVAEVTEWLQSKNISAYIIEIFQREGINGRSLLNINENHMGEVGVQLYGHRLELAGFIRELKVAWGLGDGADAGFRNGYAAFGAEDSKGAITADFPPSYTPK
jgi:hypothetical protein